jgi:hypothetical protein
MRPLKSVTGAVFAALYAIVFIGAYVYYRNHIGEWFPPADLSLILAALPFVLVMRFLAGGSFDMGGEDTFKLAAAMLFCCAGAWIVGALLEWAARAIFRALRPHSQAERRS